MLQISTKFTAQFLSNSCFKNELKNRSFQYGKVSLEVRTQKTSVTVCAQSGRHLHGHTLVVERATVTLLGQWCSGQSNATPRWDAVSSGRRRESSYGRRIAGAYPTPHSPRPRDLGRGCWAATATVRWNLVYCETKTPRCHQLSDLEHCPAGKWRSLLNQYFPYWKLLFL